MPHADAVRFAGILFAQAVLAGVERPIFEMRILRAGRDRVVSGYFDTAEKLALAAATRDGQVEAIYVTPNPTVVDCFARSANKQKPHAEATTTDAQIAKRTWFLVDIDPARPKGVSSTDAQHRTAIARAKQVKAFLGELGFPWPIVGDSGNGAHLMYRVDLPNDAESTAVAKQALEALAHRFDDAADLPNPVKVDTTVFNSARIWKMYGTMACKGDNLPEQPHRRAAILELPDPLEVCTLEQLRYLASMKPAPAEAQKPRGDFDLMTWLREHARECDLGEEKALDGGGWIREIIPCPWGDHERDRAAFVGQRASGAIIAGCRHDRCKGKGWHDLRDVFEPEWRARAATRTSSGPPPHTDADAPAERPHLQLVPNDTATSPERDAAIPRSSGDGAAKSQPGRFHPLAADAARLLWSVPLPPALPTGIAGLDRAIVGLRPESVVVLNGPPGAGKSGMAVQVTRHYAENKTEVVYITAELSARQVLARVAAQVLRVSWVRLYELGPSEVEMIVHALTGMTLRVVEVGKGMSLVDELNAITQQIGSAPVVIVDYLQLVARRLGMDDARRAVGIVTDHVLTWCKDAKARAMVLSAVARSSYDVEEGTTARQLISAAKEGGEIEYDAGAVLFLEAEDTVPGKTTKARIYVSKNRFGPPGQTIGLLYDGAIGAFADDPAGSLNRLELEVYQAIADGSRSTDEVQKQVEGRKENILKAIKTLAAKGLVDRMPLRVLKEIA